MDERGESRWRALGALLWPDRGRWLALGALVAASSVLVLAGPLVVRRLVDRAAAGADASELRGLAAVFLLVALLAQVLAVIVAWRATTAAWATTNDLRLDMTRHVLGLDHEFHRRHTPGELIQRVDGDVTSVSEFLGLVVPKALGAALTIGGMVIVLAVLDWRLAIGLVLYLGATFAIVVRGRHRAVRESSDEMGALGRLYGGIEERLVAAEDLRSNGAGAHVAWRFVEDSTDALASSVRRERAFLTMWWFVQLALAAGWVVVLVLGAWTISHDVATIGTIFLLYQYVLLIGRPLEDLVHELETVQKANGAMVRVLDLLAISTRVLDGGTVSPPPGPLTVEFDRVDFDYGDDQPVLRDVHLALGAGSLGRHRRAHGQRQDDVLPPRPATGRADHGRGPARWGADRRHPGRASCAAGSPWCPRRSSSSPGRSATTWRCSIVRCPTPRWSTRSGRSGSMPSPVATSIANSAPRGPGLSAGEAQLLSLARVWMRDPDVLVLDEATARIDPETERKIEAAVARLMVGRTTLIIAHRLSTLHAVDDIVVFDRGEVAEFGARAELIGDDESQFARLVALSLDAGRRRRRRASDEPAVSRWSSGGRRAGRRCTGGRVMTLVEHPDGLAADERSPDDTVAGAATEAVSIGSREVWRLAWRVSQHRPREFWTGWALFVVFFTMPAVTGLMLARGFEALSDGNTSLTYRYAAAVAASELIRMIAIHWGALIWTAAWIHMQTFLRANLLAAQMASGGSEAGRPVGSAGAAITHFRDDTEDVANFVDGLVDVSGGVVFTVFAGIVLGMADARAAAVLLLPLVGVAVATRTLDHRIKVYRAADRAATAEVTGLVGDVMAASTTIKVNDATDALLDRLKVLVEARRQTATRDRVLDETVQAFSQGAADVGLGLVLIVSATAIASGAFGLGDLALFTAYLGWLSFLPRMIGRVLRASQAVGRGVRADATSRCRRARRRTRPCRGTSPSEPRDVRERPNVERPERVPLERLDIVGLSAIHDGGGGVRDVSISIQRGQFVVVTGPVGAGKSTLLRALVGLVPAEQCSGEVRWNGDVIARSGGLLRASERGVPVAGAPADLRFGGRQRRARSGGRRPADDRPRTGGDRGRHRPDARRPGDADRTSRSAAVRRATPAARHRSSAGAFARTRGPRRPVERARRRDRTRTVDATWPPPG